MAVKIIGPEILKRNRRFEKYPYPNTTRAILIIAVLFSM